MEPVARNSTPLPGRTTAGVSRANAPFSPGSGPVAALSTRKYTDPAMSAVARIVARVWSGSHGASTVKPGCVRQMVRS